MIGFFTQASSRFYKQACLIILGLLVAHTACFIASVTLINAQDQYIQEVDDAGAAVITLHRMAIDCRWVDIRFTFHCCVTRVVM
jgi:hypothetical protein